MPQHGGKREGSGRTPLPESEKKIAKTIYITPTLQSDIDQFATVIAFLKNASISLAHKFPAENERRIKPSSLSIFLQVLEASGSVSRTLLEKRALILFVYSVVRLRITPLKHTRTTLMMKK